MRTLIRLVTLGFLVAACSAVSAKPILVARVDGGFLVGSNYLRSNGSRVCKLHYRGKRLLLLAGDNVTVSTVGGGKAVVVFDMDKEIWQVVRKGMTDQQLLQAVQKVVVSDTHTSGPSGYNRSGIPSPFTSPAATFTPEAPAKGVKLWSTDRFG